jgi:transcriptional regulator with PAS, ATPase and Fis domain
MNRAIDVAIQVAPTDLTVLITGESGAGKDVFPRIIHENSLRKTKKYLAVNCGAIPEGTIDSELFGHVKGAFTNAISDRKGYFGEADGGTIFLDEVAELPLATQARLLRVLESGEFIRVGSSTVEKTDVRIVAATNVDLLKAIEQGRFREDLFYRLSTIPIKVPPLRERGADVQLLFRKFAADCAEKYRMPAIQLSEDAKQMLMTYHWPGNVRQLKNVTEQISIMAPQRVITADMLQDYLPDRRTSMLPMLAGGQRQENSFENEREILYKVLFDMRRDITDLKAQVNSMSQNQQPVQQPVSIITPDEGTTVQNVTPRKSAPVDDDIQDTEVYVEETLSLDEVEKDMIKRALAKHGGKRRGAAADLNISERTLYRKIKEYNLE